MSDYDFDYFVIGAGSGGVRSARIAASLGAKVGIAEGKHFGGTCVNLGCIPKKIFSYAADYGTGFEEARNYGWSGEAKFDWKTLKANKDKEIARLESIYRNILNINKVEAFEAYASFKDDHTLLINGQEITAERILIAAGGQPKKPDIKGQEFIKTSDDIFALEELPKDIVILGAGYIGLEFAHIFHGMGCNVTLIHRGSYLLKGFDLDIQDHLLEEMQKQGIKILLNKQVAEVTDKAVILSGDETVPAQLVLGATGREPHTKNLGLEKAGVEIDEKGFVKVNNEFTTSQPHIFAIGDITKTHHLTPVAIAQGHALASTLFGGKVRHINFGLIPTAVFSKPEIATVGMSEQEAFRKGEDYTVYKTTFRPLRHTITGLETKIMMKLIVNKNTDKVLGLHIAGPEAGEMVQLAGIALNAGATKEHFDSTLPVHPTSSEELVLLTAVNVPHTPERLAERE